MNMQARSAASWKMPSASLVLLAGAAWCLLHIDWTGAACWVRAFLVFYGTWMMDP
jgi:hypothetical protein